MTDQKYTRTVSQQIQDEVRNKPLHEDIAWRCYRGPQSMRELLTAQAHATQEKTK
jgi:hypothetical protein